MMQYVQTITGTGTGAWLPLDPNQVPFSVGIGAVVSATATYTVEYTYDDIQGTHGALVASPTAFPSSFASGATTNKDGSLSWPVRAVRLRVTASTGNVVMTVLQGIQ